MGWAEKKKKKEEEEEEESEEEEEEEEEEGNGTEQLLKCMNNCPFYYGYLHTRYRLNKPCCSLLISAFQHFTLPVYEKKMHKLYSDTKS